MKRLLRLIRQGAWTGTPPGGAIRDPDPTLDGLDAFLSEDEAPGPPSLPAPTAPSFANLIAVTASCAAIGVLAAFVSRPLWATPAEAAAGETIADTASPGAGGPDTPSADAAPSPVEPEVPAAPPAGVLLVDTDPPGARVSIDNESIGVSPITIANLSAGAHEVVVESARGRVARTVEVKPGSEGSLVIAMPAAARFQSGWISVTGGVPAQIFEDGTLLGSTTLPKLMLTAGRHELEFVNDELGFHVARTVQVRAGRTEAVDLETPTGTAFINARPWAEVFVDGRRVGQTPIANLSLPIGRREVVFRHPQLGERRQTIVVGLGAPARIGVELDK